METAAQVLRWLSYLAFSFSWTGITHFFITHLVNGYLVGGLLFTAVFRLAALKCDPGAFSDRGPWPVRILAILLLIGLQWGLWRYWFFFRDPERPVPEGRNIVSPADGFVVYVKPWRAGEPLLSIKDGKPIPLEEITKVPAPPGLEEGFLIGIFMTSMSVHVNRSPIRGVVESIRHFPASNRSMLPMALRTMLFLKPYEKGSGHVVSNERETMLIRGEFPVFVTRIGDFYVDKIVNMTAVGKALEKGERIGLIKMGSQTDVVFPSQAGGGPMKILVKEGQYVYGGHTILAEH